MRTQYPLHDTTLIGFMIEGDDCTLHFNMVDGRRCEVRLTGVDALQMDDTRKQNIVVLFDVTTGETPNSSVDFDRLYYSPSPAYRDRKIKAIEAGELSLVEMMPAAGSNLLATCEQIEMRMQGNGS
jgi:hypothetical protein